MITEIENNSSSRPRVNALPPIAKSAGTQHRSKKDRFRSLDHSHRSPDYLDLNKRALRGFNVPDKRNPIGKLPSLGLSKLGFQDFRDDTHNPFTVQPNTEKILVMRELEREFGELNRHCANRSKIHEKPIETRIDRAGALRRIEEIPATKRPNTKRRQKTFDSTYLDEFGDGKKTKINIFDG